MHRKLTVFIFAMLFYATIPALYAANFVDLTFTLDAISFFDLVTGNNPDFTIFLEDIGGAAKTNNLKKYNLSTNLAAWKIDAKIDKVITGIAIEVELATVDSPYSATTTKSSLDVADTARTVLTGTNGGVANSKSITYSVTPTWAGNAGFHTYTVTFTLSSN